MVTVSPMFVKYKKSLAMPNVLLHIIAVRLWGYYKYSLTFISDTNMFPSLFTFLWKYDYNVTDWLLKLYWLIYILSFWLDFFKSLNNLKFCLRCEKYIGDV